MNGSWKNLIVSEIVLAIYVAPSTGSLIHKNRPYHGVVLNDAECDNEYIFDDGRIVRTGGYSLFYLPKGSSYCVKKYKKGGCYAVNFDAEISDQPFSLRIRQHESILQCFKAAANGWKMGDPFRNILAMRAIYESVIEMQRELQRPYLTGEKHKLIAPAVEAIEQGFASEGMKISALAEMCGVSEVYFRRLFMSAFGVSPKTYLIRKRIEYAKTLLRTGDFTVSEVALMCGYEEPCHFAREFSRLNGMPPSQYCMTEELVR